MNQYTKKIKVWDTPLRLFHWLLVLAISAAYFTAQFGGEFAIWHGRIGALVLGLLSFRIVWGFLGSTHSRFSNFLPTPSRVLNHFKHPQHHEGHNPLGALSVLALIAVVAASVITGLFTNDDIAFTGPLYNLVSKALSDRLTSLHETAFYVLLALITLHLLAVLFYLLVKKNNLIKPMLTGYKEVKHVSTTHSSGGGMVRFLIALVISIAIVSIIFGGYFEPETLTPSTTTPTW